MTIGTVARYLLGSRSAIERISAVPTWPLLGLGVVLVLTGSLARNYDGVYLPVEWPVLTHGLAASVVNAALVFGVVTAAVRIRGGTRPRLVPGYLRFLGLFWMTAPLAWVYGIPWERWLTPVQALEANAWTLAVVAVWRVLLISRVLSVLYGAALVPVLLVVLLVSDGVLLGALALAPAPPVDFMGGLRYSEQEAFMSNLNFLVGFFAVMAGPVLFLGAVIGLRWLRGGWRAPGLDARLTPSRGLWAAAVIGLTCWMGAAAWAREEQRGRFVVNRMFSNGEVAEALAYMSQRGREGFPPVWDPPPYWRHQDPEGLLDKVRDELARGGQAPWVRETYFRKSWRELVGRAGDAGSLPNWVRDRDELLTDRARARLRRIVRLHAEADPGLNPADQAALRELVESWDRGTRGPPR